MLYLIRISKPPVRDASEAGVDLAANRPLDVRPGVAVHLSHRDRGQDGEGHEDNAGHSRDLEVLIHAISIRT